MMKETTPVPIEILGSGLWVGFFQDLQRLAAETLKATPEVLAHRPTCTICCGPLASYQEGLIQALLDGHTIWLVTTHLWQADEIESISLATKNAQQPPYLELISPRQFDTDFLQARLLAQRGELGELKAVRSLAWTPPFAEEAASPEAATDSTTRFMEEISLVLEPALELCPGRFLSCQFRGLPGDWSVSLLFEGDVRAEIELRKRGHLPFATGWMVDGTLAGYRQGRLYRTATDGETIDVPVPGFESMPTFVEAMCDQWVSALTMTTGRKEGTQQTLSKLAARLPVYQSLLAQLPRQSL
ncbi:hypothetical protein Plim_3250 [Planctopirus limnophila DSM 3776]|uniref:Uncharacterized protein n=1 Tax=Planctopirus limnophila (strain ATCC 43296 / DSM 3776 / IFAM 1008 / Mu 290) TaxID=521674 RepID=D5STN5_PLAL2|nr:hypothetical protein [Planctopirus limnophila]ADG69064.1 hypothetical protein Plim_3250 [Planctopirus limnophila DSM 3776]